MFSEESILVTIFLTLGFLFGLPIVMYVVSRSKKESADTRKVSPFFIVFVIFIVLFFAPFLIQILS